MTTGKSRAYVMKSSDGKESMLVIRTENVEILKSIVKKISKARDSEIKAIADILEGDLYDEC